MSARNAIVNGLRLARWPHWSTSKLPFLGAVVLLVWNSDKTAIQVFTILGAIAAWAAFGYAVNDVADRASDARALKPNAAAGVPTLQWGSFLALSAAAALGLSWLWAERIAATALVLAGLLFSCAYSLPPLRLKERGAVGLMAGSAAQWVLPVLAIAAVESGGLVRPVVWSLGALGLAIGLRWMAVHQMQDIIADRRSGVHTYASRGGAVWPVLIGAFLSEVVFLSATLALAWPQSLPVVAALVFWIIQQLALRPREGSFREALSGYDSAPLAEYYFLLLPLTLALARVRSSPAYLVLAAMFVVLGWCYMSRMSGEWLDTVRGTRRTSYE